MSTFRQVYRKADILLVDDVHVFSRKGATQEEFFHSFNTLHLEGKQIILAANCAPQELQLIIEPRLVSRFEWGIVLPLKSLSMDELRLMLQAKSQALNFFYLKKWLISYSKRLQVIQKLLLKPSKPLFYVSILIYNILFTTCQ